MESHATIICEAILSLILYRMPRTKGLNYSYVNYSMCVASVLYACSRITTYSR